MILFDTHTHLDGSAFDADREAVMQRAAASGVGLMMVIGYTEGSSQRAVQFAESREHVYAAIGVHPHGTKDATPATYERFRALAQRPKVKAIGEIGLDFYRNLSDQDVQRRVFRAQIALAKELGLPIVIHSRDSGPECLQTLKDEGAEQVVMHCFQGDWQHARACLEAGYYIGIGGSVTIARNTDLHEVARRVPLDRLLMETDCPYLTPHPHRGKRNEPAYVRLVAECVAGLRGISIQELAERTTENGRRFFNIPRSNGLS